MRWIGLLVSAWRRSRERARWAPRLGGNHGVNFVDDDGIDGAQRFRGLRGKQQVERLRRGDENFGGGTAEASPVLLRGVTGADADFGVVDGDSHAAGHVGDAGERGTEVAFDIDGERFEWGDVDNAAAAGCRGGLQHQPVEAPEEGGEGFAGSGGGKDEGAFAAGNGGPAVTLWGGRLVEDFTKPRGGDGVKDGEGVGLGRGWSGSGL